MSLPNFWFAEHPKVAAWSSDLETKPLSQFGLHEMGNGGAIQFNGSAQWFSVDESCNAPGPETTGC